ncbi:MAG TPA: sporulation transcription factor Spo0A [Ruminococcus sp.]
MENRKINLLVGDDTAEFGVRIASDLRESGIYAYTRRKNGKTVLESIIKNKPDVAVVDLSMPEMDAMLLMKRVSEMMIDKPEFIVVGDIENTFIERQIIEGGAAYYIAKPVETTELYKIVKSVCRKNGVIDCNDIELMVTDVIHKLGVPAHIKGYHYLRTAIIDSLEDRRLMDSVTKQLYPIVARQHSTTSSRVERAIRHAIEIAWERGNCKTIKDYFGCSVSGFCDRPTNSEFIALISDRLRLKIKTDPSCRRSA